MLSIPNLIEKEPVAGSFTDPLSKDVVVDCGWGRLIFANTFESQKDIAEILCNEEPGKRDIAIYSKDPHVILSMAPQELFLDPSHHYRLLKKDYKPSPHMARGFTIRPCDPKRDVERINEINLSRDMVRISSSYFEKNHNPEQVLLFVAEENLSGKLLGVITCVDHRKIFQDPQNGISLWSLAVDPQASQPGIGEMLVRHSVEQFLEQGAEYIDLSVLHDNDQAISLYEKLGFLRLPQFFLKHKSAINEVLFTGPIPENRLNPYAMIIINEARRRGIGVEILDDKSNLFSLSFGGRTIHCRESLTELTSSVALQICSDKALTHRILKRNDLKVPGQILASNPAVNAEFLNRYGRIVVKPLQGEQGTGITIDLTDPQEMEHAIRRAHEVCEDVLLEEYIQGQDLRVLVIKNEVIAAAIRRPAQIAGNSRHTIRELIAKQSRRRENATGGESTIPQDEETKRCVEIAGYSFDTILQAGESLFVRKTANLHTGGTIHDVTSKLHPELIRVCLQAAKAINIPVVGFDLMIKDIQEPQYHFIEANERPGLANHEPHQTAERFMDLLFPQTTIQSRV
ncbi:MAG: N-acetylglutaminylglutamine synthetase [Candidatus Nitronauta litoralis]|uniref:N-acetylglutaminylglutamine synthetase n=1 Tax=Candidatus Nitronauta litoralis TaxID=2705533 RepID=A0A7T0BWI8_9BACT|nr:MAG: N-acetylglutaminylglutamine synthetase [Candidatus Nitronauta litoralis]